jgi:uncharacterized protein involved in high-affinity Fe2+ transport
MKEMQKVIITVLLVVSCMINLAAAAEMSVSQQPTGIEIGDTFTVDVTVDPMGDGIYAAQYDLSFNANILSATTQTEGDFLGQNGAETWVVMNTIDNDIGKMTYGETRLGDPERGSAESGVLASITFEVIGAGISDLTLSNVDYEYSTESEPEPSEEPPDDGEPEHYDAEELDNHRSSGSSNFAAAPAATAATPTAADDTVDSTTAAEAGSAPTTEPTGVVTPTKAATPNAPAQPGFKAPGFEAASLIMVLLYLIKRRGE